MDRLITSLAVSYVRMIENKCEASEYNLRIVAPIDLWKEDVRTSAIPLTEAPIRFAARREKSSSFK